jgi:hypothetical protein
MSRFNLASTIVQRFELQKKATLLSRRIERASAVEIGK